MQQAKAIMTAQEMGRTLDRLASEILERHADCANLAVIGVQRRGVDLAARLMERLADSLGLDVPFGKLDINLYRDDWTRLDVQPQINATEIFFDIEGLDVVLVDDVLFSGRTVRAALEAILDFGRPRLVELLVLVDRGNRELPIQADYVGKTVDTERSQHVDVYTSERDGRDEVVLSEPDA